jgi:hypothetical protein
MTKLFVSTCTHQPILNINMPDFLFFAVCLVWYILHYIGVFVVTFIFILFVLSMIQYACGMNISVVSWINNALPTPHPENQSLVSYSEL